MFPSFHTAIWLIPLLPFAAGIVNGLLPKSQKRLAFVLAVGALAGSAVLSLAFLAAVVRAPVESGRVDTVSFTWLTFGTTHLELGFLLNPLTAVMVSMVSFVSLLIFIYSHGYMKTDENYARFFAFLALFAGGMLGVCVANSLILLFISWEIVGVCSYLLIGFWFTRPAAAAAAKKAFMVTKLGDVGFFIGMLWLYSQTGTQLLYDAGHGILDASTLTSIASVPHVFMGMNLAGVLALLIFCGAVGKSGQFPLHVWLPDAMEGPTPVSALIHAATMVAAGVFLVGRMYPLFQAEPMSLTVVMWVGAFTSILAASIAVAQRDIKRILAYSTVSQLGLMMLGLGAAGFVAGIFHLLTHAFFKALLFLGSGSVIHACHDEQDIMKMGGLRSSLKVTFATYVVGALALAGVFPLAGFWSKDAILAGARDAGHTIPLVIGFIVTFLTAFYMTRQVALVFFGPQRTHDYHPHESPRVMTIPLVILAVFAAGLGFFGPAVRDLLDPHAAPEASNVGFMVVAGLVPLAGIGCGWLLYGRAPLKSASDVDPLSRLALVSLVYRALERRWYWDEIYAATVVNLVVTVAKISAFLDEVLDGITKLVAALARGLSHVNGAVDDYIVKPLAKGIGTGVKLGGGGLSRLQTGRVQDLLSFVTLGAVVLLAIYFLLGLAR